MSDDRRDLADRFVRDLAFTTGLLAEDRAVGDGPSSEGIRAAVYRAAAGVVRYSDDDVDLERARQAIRGVILERTAATVGKVVDELEEVAPPGADRFPDDVRRVVELRLAGQESDRALAELEARRAHTHRLAP